MEEGAIKGERGRGKEGYGWCRFAETVRAHAEGLRGGWRDLSENGGQAGRIGK